MHDAVHAVDPAREGVERARLLIEVGRAQEALPLIHQAILHAPHDSEPRCLLSYAHFRLGDWRSALKAAEEAGACNPLDEWSHRLRALTLLELKQNRKALLAAQEAARLEPHGLNTLKVLSRCQLQNGKRKDARQSAQFLVELAPDWADAHETLGYVALVEQKWKEAEHHYRTALALDPESWSALNDLALSLQRQRRHKEAVELFHRAAQLNPGEPLTRQNLFSSVQGYVGGGFLLVYLAIQFVQYWARRMEHLPAAYQPLFWCAMGLVLVAAVALPIWHRRRRLAEIDPSVLAFYHDESRRQRRRAWEQFGVVGGLLGGTFTCLIWWLCGWAYGPEKMGLQGSGLVVFYLLAAATVAGFIGVARYHKQLAARWKPS